MFRISQSSMAIGLLAFASLTLGFGCHLIADLEDRSLSGGAGGASASSSGDAVSSSSSGMPMSCEASPPANEDCASVDCTEPMEATNGCHCGDCNIDCGNGTVASGCLLGGLCPSHLMRVEATGLRIHRVATHGGIVAYPVFDPATATTMIRGLHLDGPLVEPDIVPTINGYVQAITVDCDMVYFATVTAQITGAGLNGEHALWFAPMDGSQAPTRFAGTMDGVGSQFETIAVDDRYVYWTDELGVGIWEKPMGQGPLKPIQRVPGHDGKTKAVGLATRGQDVYWATSKDDGTEVKIWSLSINNGTIGTPLQLVSAYPGAARQVAVDDSSVYWVDVSTSTQHRILKAERNGGADQLAKPVFTFQPNIQLRNPIAVDPTDPYVYVITYDTSTSYASTCRVNKAGDSMTCQPHTGLSMSSNLEEEWFARGGSRIYLATPRTYLTNAGQIYWITVGKLNP